MAESLAPAGGVSSTHAHRHVDAAKKKRPKHEKYIAKTVLSDPPRRLRRNLHGATNLHATATTYADDFQSPKGDGYIDPTKVRSCVVAFTVRDMTTFVPDRSRRTASRGTSAT